MVSSKPAWVVNANAGQRQCGRRDGSRSSVNPNILVIHWYESWTIPLFEGPWDEMVYHGWRKETCPVCVGIQRRERLRQLATKRTVW